MKREETATILMILRTVWQGEEITDERITAYQWAWESVTYADIEAAAKRWMKTAKFFPKPAELLEIVAEQQVAPGLIPETAWAEVIREAGRVGLSGTPKWSHPLIGEAVQVIGWYEICMSDFKNHPTLRAQFRDALKGLRAKAIHDVQIGSAPDALTPLDGGTVSALPRKAVS